ncbi:MAG: outer membrane protein assembly factor BamE [Sulfuriferula sp.]
MRVLITFSLIATSLAGCSYLPSMPKINAQTFSPYKIDIQQGNFLDDAMVDKLKVGMTRTQVKFILGTPLVTDVFHANRWDYIYTYRKDGKLTEQRRVVLYFNGDVLESMTKYVGGSKVENVVVETKSVVPAIKPEETKAAPVVPPAGAQP